MTVSNLTKHTNDDGDAVYDWALSADHRCRLVVHSQRTRGLVGILWDFTREPGTNGNGWLSSPFHITDPDAVEELLVEIRRCELGQEG